MTEQKKRYYCIVPGPNGDCPLSRAACGPPALPRGKPGPARVGSVLGAALDTWTDTPLTMWSSPHRDWATCSRHVSRVTWQEDGRGTLTSGSRKVMKANALKGFGMKTSVTSPNFEKYSFRSSAVMSSVHRPTNTLHGTCCTWGEECQIFLVHLKYF